MKLHKLVVLLVLAALLLGTLPVLAQEPEKTLPPVTVDSDANLEAGQAGPSAIWPGPDGFGYSGQSVAYNWVEISGSGTPIAGLTDDGYLGPFPIGFSFNFYGTAYTDFYAASNGYISFGAGSSTITNQCPLPNASAANNIIALMWDDLDPGDTGDLAYYQTFDPCPIGTGICLVVQYDDFCHYPGGASCTIAGTWEAILYANSGNVILQYEDAGAEEGLSSTEGIEGNDFGAGHGLTYACDTAASVVDGTAIELLFPTGLMLSPDTAAKQGCEDSDVTHTLMLANYTGADATFDLAYAGVWPVGGPASLFVPNMGTANFDVTVSIPCGGVSDVTTVTASGGGFSDASTLTTSSTAGGFTTWEAIDSINSTGRSRPAAAAVDGKIYLFGGEISGGREDTVEMFDPAVGEWVDMAGLMPVPASNICAAAIGGDIYIPGGYQYASPYYISDLQVYHTATDTWETVTTDPYPLVAAGVGCAASDGKLYAFGGTTGTYQNAAYVYDPAAPAGSRWTQLAGMTYTRAYLAGAAVNGKIYAVGGRDSATTDFAYVEAFDPADGLWHPLPNMSFARGGPGAMVWGDQLVACGGGWSLYRNNCESYDTTQGYAGAWVTLPQTMIEGRRTFAYASLPDALYAIAGYNGAFLATAERLPAFVCPPCSAGPDIEVTPAYLSATQCPDVVFTATLQVCNAGDADLTWSLAEAAPKLGAGEVTLPARAASEGKGTAAGPVQARSAGSYTIQGRAGIQAPPDVLLAVADGTAVIEGLLEAYGDLGAVDVFDASIATPTLAELQAYDVVLTWSNYFYLDATAMGNVLADYIDVGGKVSNLNFSMIPWVGYGLAGRFVTENYTAMWGTNYAYSAQCLGTYNAGHPIMAGVTDVCESFRETGTYLTPGSTEVARWADNELFVAVKDNATVATISGYVGDSFVWTGQMPDVVHNAILWLAGGVFDAPWLSEDPVGGTLAPDTCQDVMVTFDSTGLVAGDYFANLVIDSNDPDEPQVVVPVQLTVEECAVDTLHIANLVFSARMDPYGRSVTRWDVFVHNQDHLPLGMVMVDMTITPPSGSPVVRSLYTNFLGKARFHYGHRLAEPWLGCVDNLTKAGYVYEPGGNEVPNCAP
jgi:hypothetical protein